MRHPLALALILCITGDVVVRAEKAQPTHRLRIATLAPADSPLGRAYKQLNRDLLKNTEGEVGVRLYAGGVAGDERDAVRKMRVGQLDGALLTSVGLGMLVPQVAVLEAPGLIQTYDEVDRVRETIGVEFEAKFRKAGYELIGWGDVGRIRLFSKHEIRTPKDMRTLRPWVWRDSYTMKAFIKAVGANGVPLGIPEVYPGLQTNMIDTVIASSVGVLAFQWHARLKTMSKQASGIVVGAFVIRKDKFDALPEKAKDYILTSARETGGEFREAGRKLDDDSTRVLMKRLEVLDLDPYRKDWEQATLTARNALVGRLYSKSLLDRVAAVVERTRTKAVQ